MALRPNLFLTVYINTLYIHFQDAISALNNPSLLLNPAITVDVHPPEDVLCPLLRRLEAALDGCGLVGSHHGVDGVDDAGHLLGLYRPVTVNIVHPSSLGL